MNELLNKSYKAALDAADAIQAECEAAKREPTPAEQKSYTEFLDKAEGIKSQIDSQARRDALSAWGEQSAGSPVKSSFVRMADGKEGDIPGVTANPETGEMYAVDGSYKSMGEAKLASLKSGGYKDAFNDYIRLTGLGRERAMKSESMKILNEGSDTSGGFWLPPDYRPELIKRIAVMSTVRPNASVYTTGTDSITFPAVTYSANDQYTSGVRFAWRSSGGAAADYAEATNPVAGQIRIPAHLATATIICTREQLEDNSFDLLGYITQIMAESFALGEEDAFTNGDGVGKPQGFLTHPTFAIGAATTGTVDGVVYQGGMLLASTTLAFQWGTPLLGILGTERYMPPQYEAGAKWYATKASFSAIRAINNGTANLPQWSLGDSWPNYANGMTASLLGYGIEKNQFMPEVTLSTFGIPLVLGDMKGYKIVDRVGLSVEVFREVYGLRDQVVIYARKRVGGQLTDYWRMKGLKNHTS
jgi:HK97 family phage major capsid protein